MKPSVGYPKRALAMTVDDGVTWSPRPDPCPKGAPWAVQVSFVSARRGWIVCRGEGATIMMGKAILHTRDTGATWEPVAETFLPGLQERVPARGLSLSGYASGAFFRRGGEGWVWGGRGFFQVSGNGGRSWRHVGGVSVDVSSVNSLWFVSPATGFALFEGGGSDAAHEKQ